MMQELSLQRLLTCGCEKLQLTQNANMHIRLRRALLEAGLRGSRDGSGLQGVAHQSVTEESKEHLLVTQAHGQHTVQELGHLLVLLQNLEHRPVNRQVCHAWWH